jgi:hypothetical protein
MEAGWRVNLSDKILKIGMTKAMTKSSVADPDPQDPYFYGPPGSGSISHLYGSGSGSFYHQTKIVRKILILLFCDFFLTYVLKT